MAHTQTSGVGIGFASLILAGAAQAGDAPRGVIHTGNESTPGLRAIPSWLPVRTLGAFSSAFNTINGMKFPVPVILTDGSLRLQFDLGAAPSATFPPVPAAANDLAQVFHLTPDGAKSWFVARRNDGALVQWAEGSVPHDPGHASWRSLAAGDRNAGGITAGGEVVAWNISAALAVSGAPSDPRSITLGRGWGAVIDGAGTLHPIGLGAAAPSLPVAGPALDAAALPFGSSTSPSIAVVRPDGSLVSSSGLTAAGPYIKVAQGQGGLIALRADGSADRWFLGGTGAPTHVPGVYDSVHSLTACAAVWSDDTDRNGEPDRAQILRGEMPDANDDLVDDRLQTAASILDLDENGRPDCTETTGNALACVPPKPAGTGADPFRPYWTETIALGGGPAGSNYKVAYLAQARVRPGAESVTRLSLPLGSASSGFPSGGLAAMLHVWADPNQDGDPSDLVERAAVPILITGEGAQVFDFPAIQLGNAGDSYFFGLSFEQGTVGPGAWPVAKRNTEVLPSPQDGAAGSRLNGRLWVAYVAAGTATSAVDAFRGPVASGGVIRSFSSGPEVQALPAASLLPAHDTPTDCNRNGVLDSLELRDVPDAVDTNGNGVIDRCEGGRSWGDLNLDGIVNGADVGLLLGLWGPVAADGRGDLDGDGHVGGADLALLISRWGEVTR